MYINSGHWWPHNNLDYGIISGLIKLEQQVVAIDISETYNDYFYKVIKEFNPYFVFTLLGANINVNVVEKIKSMGYKIGVWIVDDPYDIKQSMRYAFHYDFIFNTELNVIDYYKKNKPSSFYLPLGTNENTFKKNFNINYKSDYLCYRYWF
ncbi:hypothetical protein ACETAC_03625 [Aceticella autotrophica]|uniref:DUF3880 domain-containing protein n=1 Tax=Aceticella autotrophica TaxID=2755338 RepID=A0A975GB54_9THEO|nr:DUF3880 domain-containing protein [Aceticella autotrophica]QSZ27970.1 hypothetical protein ACETAC_03625 [Aceticella autotrophica]